MKRSFKRSCIFFFLTIQFMFKLLVPMSEKSVSLDCLSARLKQLKADSSFNVDQSVDGARFVFLLFVYDAFPKLSKGETSLFLCWFLAAVFTGQFSNQSCTDKCLQNKVAFSFKEDSHILRFLCAIKHDFSSSQQTEQCCTYLGCFSLCR